MWYLVVVLSLVFVIIVLGGAAIILWLRNRKLQLDREFVLDEMHQLENESFKRNSHLQQLEEELAIYHSLKARRREYIERLTLEHQDTLDALELVLSQDLERNEGFDHVEAEIGMNGVYYHFRKNTPIKNLAEKESV